MRIPRALRQGAAVSACLLLLAACGQSPHQFQLTDVTGSQADLAPLQAPTAEGQVLTAQALQGKVVALFFGYTHCPDICPTTLAKLQAVTQRLGEAADKLRVVFVTVDPERDTPAVLERYIRSFSPQFIAVRPDPEMLSELTRRYHLSYRYGKRDATDNYSVDHTSQFLVFDQAGRMRLIGSYDDAVTDITGDIAYLIKHQS